MYAWTSLAGQVGTVVQGQVLGKAADVLSSLQGEVSC